MKKGYLVIILLMLCLNLSANAEKTDLTTMDYDSLLLLNQEINMELRSRPESKSFILTEGQYIVGKDIKPGKYYVMITEPAEESVILGNLRVISIYKDKAAYERQTGSLFSETWLSQFRFSFDGNYKTIYFEDGYYFTLTDSLTFSSIPFSKEDLWKIDVPKGTLIPAGVYTVGNEIPAGEYELYPGELTGGDLYLYYNEYSYKNDGSYHFNSDKHYELKVFKTLKPMSIYLEDGYIILAENDVIMKKPEKTTQVFEFQ